MSERTIIKNKKKTIIATAISITLFALAFIFITSGLNIKTVRKEQLLNYNTKSNVNYIVNLKKNNYFTEKTLPEGEQYITSIIDNIEIDYLYNLSTAKKVDATYSYKIIANVNANQKIDATTYKKVWSKDYVLKESEVLNIKDDTLIEIKDKVKINYDEYNKIINNFKKDYRLAVTSKLDVYMQVTVEGKFGKNKLEEKAKLITSIPLSEQTINIEKDFKENYNGAVTEERVVKRFNNIIVFILGIAFLAGGIYILVKELLEIIKEDKKQTTYIKNLRKYLHDYSDIIAVVKNAPSILNLKLIEFSKFEELVNAQSDLRVPIIFCEAIKNEKGYFYLITQDCAYFYILTEEE